MDVNMYSYAPNDPQLIDKIYNEFLSQGRFDKLRKECMANSDTKPAYQNLQQRVENTVTQFLRKQTWKPDLNKNQLRDSLRKHILESGFLDAGINRIVDQVVNPNVLATVFLPEVEEVVYNYFNIPRPTDKQRKNFTTLLDNEMNPPGVVETNDFITENELDSRNKNVDSNGNRSEILFDRLKKEDEEVRKDLKDGNFENELKEKTPKINDSTESLFEKISNESFCTEDKSDVGNNDSKEIIPTDDLPYSKTVEKMEHPSDDGDSQESLSRMGVENLQINEADNATYGQDSDSQGPLEIDERTMSDSENSNDSILQQMSPISQGRLTPDRELNLTPEIKKEPEEEPEVKQETDSEKPIERLPILDEKNPSTFVGRIPKIKKEDEDEKSKEKTEVKSVDSSDDSGSANKSDSDDKKKVEEKKDEKAKDKYKDDKKHREDKSRKKDDKSRSDRSRDRSRDRKKDDKSKKRDEKDKDRDKDKDKDRSRSDKSRDKSDKKPSSSSHRSSSSSHRKSSHRDDSKSRDKDRSKYDRKDKDKDRDRDRDKDKDKDKRSDDKKKREDNKKKKSKSVDDHSKERNKKDDRRSTDRDSNERDKSSSTSRSQGESSRKKDKETKGDGSSKEKYGKEEKEKPDKKKDSGENEVKGKSEKEKFGKKDEIPSEKTELLPKVPPRDSETEQVEENMEKMFSSESPIKKEETTSLPETSQNLPPSKQEKVPPPKTYLPSPTINFSDLLKEGAIKKFTFPTVADNFYQKFNSVGFKYFEDWESRDYFEFYDCEDEFREFVHRAESDLSLISDDEETDSEYNFEEINSVILKNSANGFGNFDTSLMFDPVSGDFYSWTSKIAYENALNRKNSISVPHIETDEDEQAKEEKNKENQELKKSKKKSKQPKKQEDAQKNILKHLTDGLIKTEYKEIFKTDDPNVKSALEPEKKFNEVPDEISPPLSEDNEPEKSSEETATPNPETPSSLLEDDKNDPSNKEPPKMDMDAKIRQKNPKDQKRGILTRLSSSKSDDHSDAEQSNEKSGIVEKVARKRRSPEEIDETPNKKLAKGENLELPKNKSKQKPKIRVGLPKPKSKIKTSKGNVDSPVNNFSLPLSPESDDTPLNNGAPNPVLNKRKRAPFTSPNIGAIPMKKSVDSGKKRALQQKYDSQDLYKPRPVLTGSRTRNRSLGVDSPTTKADNVQNNS